MLAVLDQTVAKSPEGLKIPTPAGEGSGCGSAELVKHFSSVKEGAVTISLGSSGWLCYAGEKKNPLLPRLFAAVDGIFCVFEGHIVNVPALKQQYGLSKTANEVIIVIEAYRTLRDRGPYPPAQVVRDLQGKFAFVLYDTSSKTTFIAADPDCSVPFFWGTDPEDNLVLSDDVDIVKKGCGRSFAPFPKGFFYTTSKGLQSLEHPLNEVKPIPGVDSQGQVCGADYTVDAHAKKKTDIGSGMPRVGSAADWSSHY